MKRVESFRTSTWIHGVLLTALVVTGGRPAFGQDAAPGKKKAVKAPIIRQIAASKPAAEDPAAGKIKKFHGRLPAYYGQVVDDKQRAEIYAIQKLFFPQIEALKAQLAALTKERNEKIDAVLTPEQQAKVDQLKAAAKAKRQQKKAPAQVP